MQTKVGQDYKREMMVWSTCLNMPATPVAGLAGDGGQRHILTRLCVALGRWARLPVGFGSELVGLDGV